jgi:ATP-binding cassette subfamily B protein
VAHRLSTIKNVDRILVFDDGRIIEDGSHSELKSINDGIFKKLWKIQDESF